MRHLATLLLLGSVCMGCGEEIISQAPDGQAAGTVQRGEKPAAEDQADSDIPPPVDFQETAFVESERSRDPFRNYAKMFVNEARGEVTSQREVILEQYSIDELRLVALIQRMHPARAMLVDPSGLGHVVQRGQYLGRASVVQPTGGVGASYEVNWRVDRIRDGDLVLVRDDPSNPDVPSATRVVPLRTDDVTASGKSKKKDSASGLENELRNMQERLAALAATEAAKKRRDSANDADSKTADDDSDF